MVRILLLPSHLLHSFWHLRGRCYTISSIFLLSIVFGTWSSSRGVFSTFQQNFPGLLVCNAWKREQSRKTTINFHPIVGWGQFFCWNENDKNHVMGGKFSWFDLNIKLHKKRGFQGLNSPMVWIPLLPSHLLHHFWDLRGGCYTISCIFLLSILYGTWSSQRGFFFRIPIKFSWPPSV